MGGNWGALRVLQHRLAIALLWGFAGPEFTRSMARHCVKVVLPGREGDGKRWNVAAVRFPSTEMG
jgi:hypothetical protein